MPSSYSTSLRFELQLTGENINTWGIKLDYMFQRADDAIAGYVAIPVTTDYVLASSNNNAVADEARMAFLKFTGSPTSNLTVTIPNVSKLYSIWNATTKQITVTTGAGSTVAIDTGDIVWVMCDGTNVKQPSYGGLSLKDYIAAAVIGATGSLPALTGNATKFLYTDAASSYWKQVNTTDLGDYRTEIVGKQVALAVAFSRRR